MAQAFSRRHRIVCFSPVASVEMVAARKAAMKVAMKAPMKSAMKAAMKAPMKAVMKKKAPMKVMKVMKMKAKKVSKVAVGKRAKNAVFAGRKEKTSGGLTKASLTQSKSGKIVLKAASQRAKKSFQSSALKKWSDAAKQARKEMRIKGFCPVGGKTAQGKALYAKVKAIVAKK